MAQISLAVCGFVETPTGLLLPVSRKKYYTRIYLSPVFYMIITFSRRQPVRTILPGQNVGTPTRPDRGDPRSPKEDVSRQLSWVPSFTRTLLASLPGSEVTEPPSLERASDIRSPCPEASGVPSFADDIGTRQGLFLPARRPEKGPRRCTPERRFPAAHGLQVRVTAG